MNEGKILYSKSAKRYFIKLNGSLRFTDGYELDSLLKTIFNDPDTEDIMVDMSEASYLDSTILGLLSKTADFMNKKFHKKVVVLSINKNINYLFENLGLDDVFIVIKSYDYKPMRLKKISDVRNSELKNALIVLDAHRQLINLNAKNKAVFKDVVELLEKEINEWLKHEIKDN